MGFLKNLFGAKDAIPDVEDLIEEVPAHFARFLGQETDQVFHELVSDTVHLDVNMLPATETRPYHVLYTTGMASRPMKGSREGCSGFAEVMVFLPGDWPLDQASFQDMRNYWPIWQLKFTARLPHLMKAFVFEWISIQFVEPQEPAPGTDYSSFMLVRPTFWGEDACRVRMKSGKVIDLYVLMPITHAETAWKNSGVGLDEVRALLERQPESLEQLCIIRPGRASMV